MTDDRNRCPYCGREFTEEEFEAMDTLQVMQVTDSIVCPRCEWAFTKDELIGYWDDCAWDI